MAKNGLGDNPTAAAYTILRERILNRQLRAGTKIPQGELAAELGISRTPLVKALHKLESEGLVDSIPQKGFYVHVLSVQELTDAYSVLEALNSVLMAEIFNCITPEHIRHLESIFIPYQDVKTWSEELKGNYALADREFHNFLWSLCRNKLAFNIHQTFQVFNRATRGGLIRDPEESLEEHLRIIAMLRERRLEEAIAAMVGHFTVTRRLLQNIVEKLKRIGSNPEEIPVDQIREL